MLHQTRARIGSACRASARNRVLITRASRPSLSANVVRRPAIAVHASSNDVSTSSEVTTGLGNYQWTFKAVDSGKAVEEATDNPHVQRQVMDLRVSDIIRPLGRTRANNQAKVEALMHSITEIGLQEPIDVLEVEGKYYGFSGCHRYEAHQRLGLETIRCRVRKANREVLKMHLM
mmetsp:Transcript_29654/g.65635  ORF Transcript_29654/g.65635 Transcript_29654/m.65635 type:complete len:175 (+) Transcript_29654:80-604(+)